MISNIIDFEMFREKLESKLLNQNKKNNAGAKPYDLIMMFKIMILQRYYGLGDTQMLSNYFSVDSNFKGYSF